MAINKTELIDSVAKKNGYYKYAIKSAIDDIFAEIGEYLINGEKVCIRGFGTFEVRVSGSHPAVHPATKERIIVPSFKKVVFRPSDELISAIRKEETKQ